MAMPPVPNGPDITIATAYINFRDVNPSQAQLLSLAELIEQATRTAGPDIFGTGLDYEVVASPGSFIGRATTVIGWAGFLLAVAGTDYDVLSKNLSHAYRNAQRFGEAVIDNVLTTDDRESLLNVPRSAVIQQRQTRDIGKFKRLFDALNKAGKKKLSEEEKEEIRKKIIDLLQISDGYIEHAKQLIKIIEKHPNSDQILTDLYGPNYESVLAPEPAPFTEGDAIGGPFYTVDSLQNTENEIFRGKDRKPHPVVVNFKI